MKIVIGLSRNNTLLSKIIRFFTNSEVSHAFIVVNDIVLHAGFPYVMGWWIQNFLAMNTVVKTFEVNVPMWRVRWAFAQCGKYYGFKTLIGFIFVLIGRKFGIHIKNPLTDNERTFVCSEFVAKIVNFVASEDVTPQDLLEHLEKVYGNTNNEG